MAILHQPASGPVVALQHQPQFQLVLIGQAVAAAHRPLVVAVASRRQQRMWWAVESHRLRHVLLTILAMMPTSQWPIQRLADINIIDVWRRINLEMYCKGQFTLVSLCSDIFKHALLLSYACTYGTALCIFLQCAFTYVQLMIVCVLLWGHSYVCLHVSVCCCLVLTAFGTVAF